MSKGRDELARLRETRTRYEALVERMEQRIRELGRHSPVKGSGCPNCNLVWELHALLAARPEEETT